MCVLMSSKSYYYTDKDSRVLHVFSVLTVGNFLINLAMVYLINVLADQYVNHKFSVCYLALDPSHFK